MKQYPPSADDVLEAFLRWRNTQGNCKYRLDHRPDAIERSKREIDVVLISDHTQPTIAAEISSICRSKRAGKEDGYFSVWAEEVRETVRDRVKGVFRIAVPIRIRKGVTSQAFAEVLISSITARASEMAKLKKWARGIEDNILGMKVSVSMARDEGSGISFGRFYEEPSEFPDEVERILRERGQKLKHHKEAGRESWLVLYNTFWIAMPDHIVREVLENKLSIEYGYIDHVAVVEGNVPDDAWIEQIR